MTDQLLQHVEDGVMSLTFNRPEKKNALTDEMYDALSDALGSAARDAAVRVVLFSSAGDSFTAGNDLAAFARQAETPRRPGDPPPSVERFIRAIAELQKPVVAAVKGQAVGIGLTMLLHCDLVYVADDAKLSAPFVSLAVVPEAASSLLLVARLGHARAFSIFAGGQVLAGSVASDWGLANQALPAGEVDGAARAAAKALARQPSEALRITKGLMRESERIATRIGEEFGHFATRLTSPEAKETFRAFAERRAPDFARVEAELEWDRTG
jgi:enoyl-CoA hydratase/carnithine racemase